MKINMKKLLTISSIVLGGFLFAQEKDYQVEKTESGISIMPYSAESVPLEVIQKNFVYKKYTVELLKKLIKTAEKDATFFESIQEKSLVGLLLIKEIKLKPKLLK